MTGVVSPSPQLFYGFTLGMLAAVNPCGFPLLPAYLELFTGGRTHGGLVGRAGRAVTAAAFSTLGFIVLFASFGVVVEVGWSVVADHALTVARYVMVGVGVAMAAVGSAALLHCPLRVRLPELRSGLGLRRPAALVVFGVSYGIASLGCALPLFVSGVATTFTHHGAVDGIASFVAYSLGMGAVLGALALLVALAGPAAARPLRRVSRLIPVLGNLLLLAVGLYLAWYWLAAIAAPVSSSPIERTVATIQQHVAAVLADHPALIGGVLGAGLIAAVLVGGLSERHRSSPGVHQPPRPAVSSRPDHDAVPEPARSSR